MDQVAPWFLVSGHLTMSSWEKLGKDLQFAEEQGVLAKGVLLVWKFLNNCIGDEELCNAELEKGHEALGEGCSQNLEVGQVSSDREMLEDDLESIADSLEKVKVQVESSAPGPLTLPPYVPAKGEGCSLHPETWREL